MFDWLAKWFNNDQLEVEEIEIEINEEDQLFQSYLKDLCDLDDLEEELIHTKEDLLKNPNNEELQLHILMLEQAISDLELDVQEKKTHLYQ